MTKRCIVLFGKAGSGKGTEAEKLSHELGFLHISTGDLLREEVAKKSPIGMKVESIMNQGNFPADELIFEILNKRLESPDAAKGVLLDGVPRTLNQLKHLDHLPLDCRYILIDVPDEILTRRITGRYSCEECGMIYNKFAPDFPNRCTRCGGLLVQRKDDTIETLQKRLAVYKEMTAPVVRAIEERGSLHVVNGDQTPEAVHQQILTILNR